MWAVYERAEGFWWGVCKRESISAIVLLVQWVKLANKMTNCLGDSPKLRCLRGCMRAGVIIHENSEAVVLCGPVIGELIWWNMWVSIVMVVRPVWTCDRRTSSDGTWVSMVLIGWLRPVWTSDRRTSSDETWVSMVLIVWWWLMREMIDWEMIERWLRGFFWICPYLCAVKGPKITLSKYTTLNSEFSPDNAMDHPNC